jgi:hypothetical protein
VLLCTFIVLFAFTWISDFNPNISPSKERYIHWYYISFGNIHVTVAKQWGVKLILFNQAEPYTGSLLALGEGEKEIAISHYDGWGIYFRSIKHTIRTDWNQWTLMISLWYPIIIFGIMPTILGVRRLRDLQKRQQSAGERHIERVAGV